MPITDHPIPTLHDILTARANVYRHLRPTPLHHYAGLSHLVGAEVWLKNKNHQHIGAFKVRGGLTLVAGLSEAERRSCMVTATTGNHGQSIAFAARAYGV
jgi:threonine dehydratase